MLGELFDRQPVKPTSRQTDKPTDTPSLRSCQVEATSRCSPEAWRQTVFRIVVLTGGRRGQEDAVKITTALKGSVLKKQLTFSHTIKESELLCTKTALRNGRNWKEVKKKEEWLILIQDSFLELLENRVLMFSLFTHGIVCSYVDREEKHLS